MEIPARHPSLQLSAMQRIYFPLKWPLSDEQECFVMNRDFNSENPPPLGRVLTFLFEMQSNSVYLNILYTIDMTKSDNRYR